MRPQSRCHVGESPATHREATFDSPPTRRGASMFELKLPESDDSEGTARASHARLFRWAVRLMTYIAIWITAGAIGAHAAPRRPLDDQARYRLPPGTHAWCDRITGRCGVHDARHHEVGISVP